MTSPRIDRIRTRIAPLRQSLLSHPVYARIDGIEGLRLFMEDHAFAVWDFMSLLKALQRRICCVEIPWTPPADARACRMINEIVLAEESDEDGQGGFASHFELYLRAMTRAGASTAGILSLVDEVRKGLGVIPALDICDVREPVRRFVAQTFEIIDRGDVCAIASAFAFGREDLLPEVFRRIVEELDRTQGGGLGEFRYYLDRHIELDGDDHGPMAERLVENLCGSDPDRWRAAEDAAVRSLEARLLLWDRISSRLEERAARV